MDTNVFSAFLTGDDEAVSTMQVALESAAAEGVLLASPAVYAELVAGRDSRVVDIFFSDKGIDVDWNLGADVWRTAGARYGDYARTRRQQRRDAGPRRILADFLIGAHALHLAHALLTSDTRIYGTYFPELEIISAQNPSRNPGGTP